MWSLFIPGCERKGIQLNILCRHSVLKPASDQEEIHVEFLFILSTCITRNIRRFSTADQEIFTMLQLVPKKAGEYCEFLMESTCSLA